MAPNTASKGTILVVDDDPAMCEFLEQGLGTFGFSVEGLTSEAQALERIERADLDAVVTDLRMRGMGGHELCRAIVARRPDLPVLVLTAFGTYETAVDAIRVGAYDFLSKPVQLDTLAIALTRATDRSVLRREVQRLRRSLDETQGFGEILGESPSMRRVYRLLSRIAGSDSSVLLTGESGTGKELVARALHTNGSRPEGPFVAINCAAMPEPLLEAELFGHEKGAFTDAKTGRAGLLVLANGGTLFLDEIGDMPMGLQVKLLRAVQERTVRPVGGRREVPFDARIITATNRDLEGLIELGRFREDLYFRVNVIQVELPPLRARGQDVLLLAQAFLQKIAGRTGTEVTGIDPEAASKLLAYAWPGNVRELQNCIERAVALAHGELVTVQDLPDRIARTRPAHQLPAMPDDEAGIVPLEELERGYILRALELVGGSRARAAKLLGLDRTTLWRKLERYRLIDEKNETKTWS
ncbi:sigma-54-dependent transcriptional regulator [Labilithrix luteola]|nr:sigma-54 dependent transcriptional regulator [Labilithrix luteola]